MLLLKVEEATEAGRIELTRAVLAAAATCSCELFAEFDEAVVTLAGTLTLTA